jgi:V/A-type H+-transporting ATPase subunit A
MAILQEEAELEEIVRLVGLDALSPESRIVMETARAIREDFLHQNAFHEVDTYSSFKKMVKLMELIMQWHELAVAAQKAGVPVLDIAAMPVREKIARAKFTPEDRMGEFESIRREIAEGFKSLTEKAGAGV